ncbi:hypothetical protein A2X44_02305 [candidate division CPR3 bacterium GWF2_35_18]|uniref:TVP38/TMEM64 family membrane protein n=1 Tax=candidate division CPR3 bacterium GW2011_GWF2_35_18 TaxID=1618350 RepID=A0A0G0BKJ2_UNCC3|nr:MAG: hypothetical protein UR67_C0002G0144 [candidate division CPR3 bacterium GW2011_GWF2_35_18]KKP86602.1 MAG: hypothetical protein UR87_C0015G0013 [candidate division CPR3 bacterium GW2011_GWE2_35_7]OGB62827.1 MAG: hypothetical protein A2X44_02305 [candidate division CPR3 bacterium GWF2_35_18]OGB65408.1 MAG: hypothetical protein A2250_00520 [candidate division CPR3 bacterium RIFOXYA2_FULL_35_13]OGB76849.1 MAG: hypothetical protein A2476_04225 [candidate division CPR3 bacterium RIFOXYC2_FULL
MQKSSIKDLLTKKNILLLIGLLLLVLFFYLLERHITVEFIKPIILSFGIFTPIAFISLTALTTVVAFVAAPTFWVAGMWIFGEKWGLIYVYIGNYLGHIINFLLVRRWGEPIIRKIGGDKTIKKTKALLKILNLKNFTIIRFLGGPPTDPLSLAAGLTKITIPQYVIISLFGFIPNTILTYYFIYFLTFERYTLMTVVVTSITIVDYAASILYPLYAFHKMKKDVN